MEFVSRGMEAILGTKDSYPYTGPERFLKTKDPNITHYKDQYGSHRFVLEIDGSNVSGIQVMERDGRFEVANVITLMGYRQMGYARRVFNEAKRKLKTKVIYHSRNLSHDGRIFADRVN